MGEGWSSGVARDCEIEILGVWLGASVSVRGRAFRTGKSPNHPIQLVLENFEPWPLDLRVLLRGYSKIIIESSPIISWSFEFSFHMVA